MPNYQKYKYFLIQALHEDGGKTGKVLRAIASAKHINGAKATEVLRALRNSSRAPLRKVYTRLSGILIPGRNEKIYDYLREVLRIYLNTVIKRRIFKITGSTPLDVTYDELEEIFLLVENGTVNVTLEELCRFYETTPLKGTSDPPLTWRT